jgi:hypothetical protein
MRYNEFVIKEDFGYAWRFENPPGALPVKLATNTNREGFIDAETWPAEDGRGVMLHLHSVAAGWYFSDDPIEGWVDFVCNIDNVKGGKITETDYSNPSNSYEPELDYDTLWGEITELVDYFRKAYGNTWKEVEDELVGGWTVDEAREPQPSLWPGRLGPQRDLSTEEIDHITDFTLSWDFDGHDENYDPYRAFEDASHDELGDAVQVHWGNLLDASGLATDYSRLSSPDADNVARLLELLDDARKEAEQVWESRIVETPQDENAIHELAQGIIKWLLDHIDSIRDGYIGGGDLKGVINIGTIEDLTGYLRKHRKQGSINDVHGRDAAALETIVKDTRMGLIHPMPDDAEGAYNAGLKFLILDLELVKKSPPRMLGTIMHELRHALDSSKSNDRFNKKDDAKNYIFQPLEINARFTQALDDIRKMAAKNPQPELLMDIIKFNLNKHNIRQIFPGGTKSPRYRRLVNRVYQQLEYHKGKTKP